MYLKNFKKVVRLLGKYIACQLTPRFHRVRLRRVTGALRARYGHVTGARYGCAAVLTAIAATLVNGCYSTTRGALRLRSVPEASQKRPRSGSAQGSSKIRIESYFCRGAAVT